MCFVSDIFGVYNVLINVFCKLYVWGLQCINKCVL